MIWYMKNERIDKFVIYFHLFHTLHAKIIASYKLQETK